MAALGPDMMGFIFYRRSPRNAFGLSPEAVRGLQDGIVKVGVFVDEPQGVILDTVRRYSLEAAQLHGGETPELCMSLRSKGLVVIKAIGIGAPEDVDAAKNYAGSCDLLLFDTKTQIKGGSGQKFATGVLAGYDGLPFLLSGG
ncbi:MAG: phosphoribosylanthranilate isomerase, partial [Alistipes sp.]|nr:phosphoribosylanthranilate isomerase [Alistipes sp.]